MLAIPHVLLAKYNTSCIMHAFLRGFKIKTKKNKRHLKYFYSINANNAQSFMIRPKTMVLVLV